ncbi:MAG: polysaccharide deacetylase family protein [Hyphomonadaceae bacterium]|nr:polysaccharide deacetylase family protein [Hyphomonadaceae bacterium]
MIDAGYAPPRDIASKIRRRMTQALRARPARLSFDQAALSVCFDDFPASAAEHGARILERHGGRGTFYTAAGLAETDGPCGRNFSRADLARLAAAGHEIACHTYDHADCAQRDVFDTLTDIARNRDALRDMGVTSDLHALAYPYGETSIELKAALPPRFASARGILPGLNVGAVDLAQLRAYPLYGGHLAAAHAALSRAAKRKAWMIAFTHDVSAAPSPYGVSVEALDRLVAQARALGMLIAPVTFVLERARR